MITKNQTEQILEHLKKYEKITSIEAIQEYGITRLSAKIHNLRKRGFEILSLPTVGMNRWNKRVVYATYKLSEMERLSNKF